MSVDSTKVVVSKKYWEKKIQIQEFLLKVMNLRETLKFDTEFKLYNEYATTVKTRKKIRLQEI